MRYTTIENFIDVIGRIWLPPIVCALRKVLTARDVEDLRDENGNITRESVAEWLTTNTGDFQEIIDFSVDITLQQVDIVEHPKGLSYKPDPTKVGFYQVDFPWAKEESEITFNDCMYGDDPSC